MTLLPVHVAAGAVGIVSGFVALFVRKGGRLHRKSGMVFVYAMLVMAVIGAGLASIDHHRLSGAPMKAQRISVLAGVLTFYLVVTALLTVRRRTQRSRWVEVGALLVALAVCVLGFGFGMQAAGRPGGTLDGLPAAPAFIFGSVALLAAVGDVRLMLARGVEGAPRIARHLWRMCFALWIGSSSFFLGQAKFIPQPLRIMPLLAFPVLLVLVLMFYWLARVRFGRTVPRRV
jgi:peptidoglycan/LPS O-acetylase OafA/YrhL